MKKLACVSLGCDKNRVDTEYILAKAANLGYQITQDVEICDIILINTCAFLESSRKEAIDTVLEFASKKQPHQKLIVSGCLPQIYIDELAKELPEADGFLSIYGYLELEECLQALSQNKRFVFSKHNFNKACAQTERVLTTPQHYAYLKISDGCKNKCTYCLIPKIRGNFRSVPMAQLIDEAAQLAKKGVAELILVAQDLTQYGEDLYDQPALIDLLSELEKLPISKIRLLYCYPERVTDELIEKIANSDKIAKYIDIPLQAVSDKILKLMGRKSTYNDICSLVEKLKKANIAIRSTFIVGFPQESEEDFKLLCGFLKKYELDNVGFFAYSDEDVPSSKLSGKIDEKIKQERLKKLYSITQNILKKKNKARIGQVFDVIIDGIDFENEIFFGRSDFFAPEIDGKIFIEGGNVAQGENYKVEILKTKGIDLVGKIIN